MADDAELSRRAELSHRLACEAAQQLVNAAEAAGLPWPAIAVSCETVVAVVVLAVTHLSRASNPALFAQEMVDQITEAAHLRIQLQLLGREKREP